MVAATAAGGRSTTGRSTTGRPTTAQSSAGLSLTGLSTVQLDSIRSMLDVGRKPKVVFTPAAGQIAGQPGQIVALLDPPDGEWIMVRFDGDELPFSPGDLAIPAKAPAKRTPRSTGSTLSPIIDRQPIDRQPNGRQPNDQMTNAEVSMPATNSSTVDKSVPATPPGAPNPAPRPAGRIAKPKPAPSLVVTIAYLDGDWTVGAQQGAKALAKPYLIKAAEAMQLVGMLDVPGVHEAVEQIVEAERAQSQAHAARLRAELAQVEARLADLPSTR